MSFRAHEKVAVRIQPQAATEMTQEVISADVVRASSKAAGGEGLIGAQAFHTNAGHQLRGRKFSQFRNINSVEVPKYRTVGLIPTVNRSTDSPCYLATNSQSPLKQEISAEARVSPTAQ